MTFYSKALQWYSFNSCFIMTEKNSSELFGYLNFINALNNPALLKKKILTSFSAVEWGFRKEGRWKIELISIKVYFLQKVRQMSSFKILILWLIQITSLVDKHFSYKFSHIHILPISIMEGAVIIWIPWAPSKNQDR